MIINIIKKNYLGLLVSKIFSHNLIKISRSSAFYIGGWLRTHKKRLDLVFDLLVIKLYIHLLQNMWIFVKNILLFAMLLAIYVPELLFTFVILLTGCIVILWMLIYWIYKLDIKKEYTLLHTIMKYVMFALFLIFLFNLFVLINSIFVMLFGVIKYNIMAKLQVLKDLVESKYNKNFRNPNPKKFPFLHFYSDWRKKSKFENLKKKVIKKQGYNYTNKVLHRNSRNNNDNGHILRNWNETLNIREEFLTKVAVLKNINEKFEFYTDQKERFMKTINNISQGKETFYSNDSAVLFKEYLKLIDFINAELKAMEEQVKQSK